MDVGGDELKLVGTIGWFAAERGSCVGHAVISVGPTDEVTLVVEAATALLEQHQPEPFIDRY